MNYPNGIINNNYGIINSLWKFPLVFLEIQRELLKNII